MDTTATRKARGAFFTPPEISQYVADWAIRQHSDDVFEPSCGEASFLLSAGKRLCALRAKPPALCKQLHGIEIHPDSARSAAELLSVAGFGATIDIGDFFSFGPKRQYDAIVGNPPFVRYQQHSGASRARSLEAALAQGVRLNGLASSWAAFVVHASSFLKPDGRLGLVVPAELLSVKYAAEVRAFLLRRFARIRLVLFQRRVFPNVLEEVLLLLAEGNGGAKCFEVYQTQDASSLVNVDVATWTQHEPGAGEKWTPALLDSAGLTLYQQFASSERFTTLRDWGRIYLGSVTGNNAFFTLTRSQCAQFSLRPNEVLPISPPGSRHLHGLTLTSTAWRSLMQDNAKGFLFYPQDRLSAGAREYIKEGERRKVDQAYKCEVRSPWWQVPLVQKPDLFFTYMNHDHPRLVANEAKVHVLNSVYGIRLARGRTALGRELLPAAALNSVTLLGSEIIGRSYGGGLLKVEPREADMLPVPSHNAILESADELRRLKPQLGPMLRQGNLSKAVELIDGVILRTWLGLSDTDLIGLRQSREFLFCRRLSRSKGPRVAN